MIIDQKVDSIVITKNGKPVAQLNSVKPENKRIGAAKKEMSGFNISQEEFDSIKIEGFDKYL